MPRITVHARGVAPLTIDLAPQSAALFGRSPSAAGLQRQSPVLITQCVSVSSADVSASHLLVWSADNALGLLDPGSRNGVSLRLPSGVAVRTAPVSLSIELAPEAHSSSEGPPDAVWSRTEDFADAVCAALQRWLDAQGSSLACGLSGREGTRSLRLADGSLLTLEAPSGATLDLGQAALSERAARYVEAQNARYDETLGHDDLVLRAQASREVHRRVYEASVRGRRLLLLGPSGSGKERFAACYHQHSRRAEGPFKAVHCGLVEDELLWVQLFGATRGSFTGAVRDVVGAVESAHGGTLFLDEVAELSPRVQAGLLRLLDRHGEYERLGDPRTRRADVQVVVATNADLRALVARGTFREDLWYRFAACVVQVPGLRERPEDLVAFLSARFVGAGVSVWDALGDEARATALAHPWHGNFRELDNFASRVPPGTRARALSGAWCAAALREGSVRDDEVSAGVSAPPDGAWDALLQRAAQAWSEDHHGASPANIGALREFTEQYLKPLFIAAGSGIAPGASVPSDVNYSALGRSLDIADGTTVKKALARYGERFVGRSGGGTGV